MEPLPPHVRVSLTDAQLNAVLSRTEALWKRPRSSFPVPFDSALAGAWLGAFFDNPGHGLELLRTFVEIREARFTEIQMLVRYTDEEDGTGLTRWFVWRRLPERPGELRWDDEEGW